MNRLLKSIFLVSIFTACDPSVDSGPKLESEINIGSPSHENIYINSDDGEEKNKAIEELKKEKDKRIEEKDREIEELKKEKNIEIEEKNKKIKELQEEKDEITKEKNKIENKLIKEESKDAIDKMKEGKTF